MGDRGIHRGRWLHLFCALALLAAPLRDARAAEGSLAVPIDDSGVPPQDLIYEGKSIDPDAVHDLIQKGIDVSLLDPESNGAWRSAPLPPSEQPEFNYPGEGSTVQFAANHEETSPIAAFLGRVIHDSRYYQIVFSTLSHPALMRAALLQKLGYQVPSPRHYSQITVQFPDKKELDAFVKSVVRITGIVEKDWVVAKSESEFKATFRDVVLEPAQADLPPFHWGILSEKSVKGRRALRALILPFELFDIDESINQFSWEFGRIENNSVVLTHPYADGFKGTTYSDLKWIARRIGALTREDLWHAVTVGRYPPDVSALILEKLIARRNQMIALFQVPGEKLAYNTRLNIGAVKNGKLTQERYEGYPIRFALGDPSSPINRHQIKRFIALQGIASGMASVVQKINETLTIQGPADIGRKRQADFQKQCLESLRAGKPCLRKIGNWGGPVAGFNVNLSRDVITGTYYGDDNKVQMVDSVAIQGQVGYFLGNDAYTKINPGLVSNVMYQRNYVHVRPVADLGEALKTNWAQVNVPHFMNGMASLIDPENSEDSLKRLQEKLKDGEMLIVTDSVIQGNRINVGIPLHSILDAKLLGSYPSVSFGGGLTFSVLKRTTIARRTAPSVDERGSGLHIYIQSIQAKSLELSMDFNWWINLYRISTTLKQGQAYTKAFRLPEEPESIEARKSVLLALHRVLSDNDSELLERDFPHYALKHETTSKQKRQKILWWRKFTIEENHRVKVRPPAEPENGVVPEKEERTLYSSRYSRTTGANKYSFITEVISGFGGDFVINSSKSGENPSNSFLGSSQWESIATEAEVTPGRESRPVTLIEHHWGGWTISKAKLFKLFDKLEARISVLNLAQPLIRRDVFTPMESLQLFDVQTMLIVYKAGVEKVESILFSNPGLATALSGLIYMDGGYDQFEKWCESQGRPLYVGPTSNPSLAFHRYGYTERENGKKVDALCVKPWMKEILSARSKRPGDAEARVRWTNQIMRNLETHVELPRLIDFLGKDNLSYQIRVSGFRTNDETADFEHAYVSDAIGSVDSKDEGGIFREFGRKYYLMSNELYARYLAEGF